MPIKHVRAEPKRATATKTPKPKDAGSMLHIRVSDRLKADATTTLGEIGFTTSEAIRLFLHRVVVEQRLPLDLSIPNAETRAAILEARGMVTRTSRFGTPQAMFDRLEETS